LADVLLYTAEAMETAASCLPKDICYRWYPTPDDVAASATTVTGFVVVAMVGLLTSVVASTWPPAPWDEHLAGGPLIGLFLGGISWVFSSS
jgi:hypothetical protein